MEKVGDTELFCSKCGLSDHYWIGGGSWAIDHCPRCESQECTAWSNMSIGQKIWARESNKRWKEKQNG